MISVDYKTMTFHQLDKIKGMPDLPPLTEEEFPLPEWYRRVYDVPLENLTTVDICKACRQEIHLEEIVPMALSLLKNDICAGDFYDGELLVAMNRIPSDFWSRNSSYASELTEIVQCSINELTSDLAPDVAVLLEKLKCEGKRPSATLDRT